MNHEVLYPYVARESHSAPRCPALQNNGKYYRVQRKQNDQPWTLYYGFDTFEAAATWVVHNRSKDDQLIARPYSKFRITDPTGHVIAKFKPAVYD